MKEDNHLLGPPTLHDHSMLHASRQDVALDAIRAVIQAFRQKLHGHALMLNFKELPEALLSAVSKMWLFLFTEGLLEVQSCYEIFFSLPYTARGKTGAEN